MIPVFNLTRAGDDNHKGTHAALWCLAQIDKFNMADFFILFRADHQRGGSVTARKEQLLLLSSASAKLDPLALQSISISACSRET